MNHTTNEFIRDLITVTTGIFLGCMLLVAGLSIFVFPEDGIEPNSAASVSTVSSMEDLTTKNVGDRFSRGEPAIY